METKSEKKQEIRRKIAAVRASLSDAEKDGWDKALKERLFAMEEFSSFLKEDTNAGAMGILEPKGSDYLLPEAGDIILVPAVALDSQGHRIGYGGGYYDRFFGSLQEKNCLKVGIIYDFQLFRQLPEQAHDCTLDRIVTPTQTIVCRRK